MKKTKDKIKKNCTGGGLHSVVSFFCGCGGLDLGFHGDYTYKGMSYPRTKFNILKAYDNEAKCIVTYNENLPPVAEQLDLQTYDPVSVPQADILLGGFPCQDFSNAGPRRGLTSERGRLYKAMIRYMEQYQPKVVVGENVLGLKSAIKGVDVLNIIVEDLKKVQPGYNVEVWQLYAPDFGVPQTRTRLIIVAVRSDLKGFPVKPEATFTKENYRSAKWAIEDLEDVADDSIPNQDQYFKALKATSGDGQGDEVTQANLPSFTIRANPRSRIQFHYKLDRRLTMRECARMQTFPDDFVFPFKSMTTTIKQIGNAVPPMLGSVVAQSIQQFLENQK